MLGSILKTLLNATAVNTPQVTQQVAPQVKVMLIKLAKVNMPLSRAELQKQLGLKDRESFRKGYLQPALAAGLIEMIIPDKPNSRLQAYRLTPLGRQWLSAP